MTGLCPCESEKPYLSCCATYHQGQLAPTAEILMRSRYSAYVMKLEDYLLKTWHKDTRPNSLELESSLIKWLGLSVIKHEMLSDSEAIVEFIAKYRLGGGRAEKMHEISRFVFIDKWYYVSGEIS